MFSFLFAQQLNIISLPRFRHSGFSHGVAQTVHDYTLRMPVRLGQTSSPGEKRRKRSSALVHAPVAALTQRRRRISLYRRRTASLRGLQSVFAVAQPVLAGRSRCLSAPAPTIQFFFLLSFFARRRPAVTTAQGSVISSSAHAQTPSTPDTATGRRPHHGMSSRARKVLAERRILPNHPLFYFVVTI